MVAQWNCSGFIFSFHMVVTIFCKTIQFLLLSCIFFCQSTVSQWGKTSNLISLVLSTSSAQVLMFLGSSVSSSNFFFHSLHFFNLFLFFHHFLFNLFFFFKAFLLLFLFLFSSASSFQLLPNLSLHPHPPPYALLLLLVQ